MQVSAIGAGIEHAVAESAGLPRPGKGGSILSAAVPRHRRGRRASPRDRSRVPGAQVPVGAQAKFSMSRRIAPIHGISYYCDAKVATAQKRLDALQKEPVSVAGCNFVRYSPHACRLTRFCFL